MGKNFSESDFDELLPNEEACLAYLFKQIYSERGCVPCGSVDAKYYRVRGRRCYECGNCGNQVYPTKGTAMHGSTTPLRKWFKMAHLIVNSKNGVSASFLARQVGVTYKTALRMRQCLRFCLAGGPREKLSGTVEVDETYIGGRRKAKGKKKVGYNGRENKVIVFGMYQRGGPVKTIIVQNTSGDMLLPLIERYVEKGSTIYSDEHAPYKALPQLGYKHDFITHKQYKFQRGDVTTNRIESFWSYAKGPLRGTYKHASAEWLWSYLVEMEFLYNNRKLCSRGLFDALLVKLSEGTALVGA